MDTVTLDQIKIMIHDIRQAKAREMEAKQDKQSKAKVLAELLCPFRVGEIVRIARPHRCSGIELGEVRYVFFDVEYGYSMQISPAGTPDAAWASCCVPGRLNAEIEDANGKLPLVPEHDLAALLKPFQALDGYY